MSDVVPLLRPGDTCWRLEHANRFTFIVDAATYFKAARAAILKAEHSVMLIGWDFDTRIEMVPGEGRRRASALGKLITKVAKEKPHVKIYMLRWDFGVIQTLGRGTTAIILLRWMARRNFRFKLDKKHPRGASHHQKLVVIDDALAFCGGIDMTKQRWDTSEHDDDNKHRIDVNGRPYGPWHDATSVVDGDVARALGELARERWRRATGETLPRCQRSADLWPGGLSPTIENTAIAIARTMPELGDQPQIVEVESLYLAAIAAARRVIYLESQYFASRRIAEAMVRRLQEEDGPEIVIVNSKSAHGWLAEKTMDSARAKLVKHVRRADRHGRFHILHPVTAGGEPIYVHAKVMVVDDRLLRVGSSNLNNRSMGFDTECDLAIEAVPGSVDAPRQRAMIVAIRNELLAEHLGVTASAFAEALRQVDGSLSRAIQTISKGTGRTLLPLEIKPLDALEDVLADSDLVDPERPPGFWQKGGGFRQVRY